MGLSLATVLVAGRAAAMQGPVHAAPKFRSYDGPPITQLQVHKGKRKLYLISGEKVVKTYRVALGSNPEGAKQWEGDGRTPEGIYVIDALNPNSIYHLSLRISYPNADDAASARSLRRSPGGEIFIHGRAGLDAGRGRDWTAGCIAVSDDEIEEIYAMVRPGTVIFLFA
jgi:murein L,D-transpeptidase YafK